MRNLLYQLRISELALSGRTRMLRTFAAANPIGYIHLQMHADFFAKVTLTPFQEM
jgi:hypothetical protein